MIELMYSHRPYPYSFLLAIFLIAPAFAWGGDGHQIVCLVAEAGLNKDAKAMITSLLDGAGISDAEIANWADQIRQDRPETGPWHYVNISISSKGFEATHDSNNGNNVVDKVAELAKVVADKSQPKLKRAEALKFLVHLVGDIHQPMHCGDRNDRGGNTRLVFFLEQPEAESLHRVWDSEILWHHKGPMRVADYADKLVANIDKNKSAKWTSGTPIDWANESMALSRDVAYANVPADGRPPKLDQAYVDKAADTVDEQLTKAGVRLAALLNRAAR